MKALKMSGGSSEDADRIETVCVAALEQPVSFCNVTAGYCNCNLVQGECAAISDYFLRILKICFVAVADKERKFFQLGSRDAPVATKMCHHVGVCIGSGPDVERAECLADHSVQSRTAIEIAGNGCGVFACLEKFPKF